MINTLNRSSHTFLKDFRVASSTKSCLLPKFVAHRNQQFSLSLCAKCIAISCVHCVSFNGTAVRCMHMNCIRDSVRMRMKMKKPNRITTNRERMRNVATAEFDGDEDELQCINNSRYSHTHTRQTEMKTEEKTEISGTH